MILTYSLGDADVTWLGAFFRVTKLQAVWPHIRCISFSIHTLSGQGSSAREAAVKAQKHHIKNQKSQPGTGKESLAP